MKTNHSPLKQYHYLYKITNLINNKIYIGIHSTDYINDGYFGSGRSLCLAFKKYGKENFKKEILEWFDWKCEALQREAEIVNKEFIKRNDVYNLRTGGNLNFCYSDDLLNRIKENAKRIMTPEIKEKIRKAKIGKTIISDNQKENQSKLMKTLHKQKRVGIHNKNHSDKTIILMKQRRQSVKNIEHMKSVMKNRYNLGNNPKAKRVIVNNITYDCIKAAYESHDFCFSISTFRNILKANNYHINI